MILGAEATNGWDVLVTLAGGSGIVGALGLAWLTARRSKEAAAQATAANRAVNGRPAGDPSIYELVAEAATAAKAAQASAAEAVTVGNENRAAIATVSRKIGHHLEWHQTVKERADRGALIERDRT